MPNFVNKPLARAAEAVQQAGLKLGGKWGAMAKASAPNGSARVKKNFPPAPALTGTVVKQYPLTGQKVSPGTEVYFEVKQ